MLIMINIYLSISTYGFVGRFHLVFLLSVFELLCEASMWKDHVIGRNFQECEAKLIFSPPLCGTHNRDNLIWRKIYDGYIMLRVAIGLLKKIESWHR